MKHLLRALVISLAVSAGISAQAAGTVGQDEIKIQIIEAAAKYKSGDLTGAITQLEATLDKAPDNPEVLSWLGFFYVKDNQMEKAISTLEKAQKLSPNDLEVSNNLGNAYLAMKQDDKALAQYKMVVEKKPEMFEPWYNIGGICLRKKDYAGAVKAYETAISLKGEDVDAYSLNNLGIAYEGSGQLAKAADCYSKAAEAKPGEYVFHKNAGLAYYRLKDNDKALEQLEAAQATGKADVEVARIIAQIYIGKGESAKALDAYKSLESEFGDKSDYWYNLGVLCTATGDSKGAEGAYRKAISMNQNDKDAIQNLGILLFKDGRYEDALPFFERLYKLNPTPSATLNYASCLSQVGDLKKATQLWRAYLQQNPRRNDVRVELANALWQMGDKEGSRSQYASVLAAEPNNVQAMNGLGLYYYGADRLKDAEGIFRKAIASKKTYLPPYNNLAVTLERMNKRPEAIRLLEAALKMNPDYAEAKKNLERMRSAG